MISRHHLHDLRRDGDSVVAWQTTVDLRTFPELADHQLQGIVALPGSWYLEMARAAVGLGVAEAEFTDIAFHTMCVVRQGRTRLDIRVTAAGGDGSDVEIRLTRDPPAQSGPVCATMRLRRPSPLEGPLAHEPFDRVVARCARAIGSADLYRELRDNGNQFGPAFQGLAAVYAGDDEAIGIVRPESTMPLLDAAAQLVMAVGRARGQTCVLRAVDRMWLRQEAVPAWIHVRGLVVDRAGAGLCGEVVLVDDQGGRVGQCRGLQLAVLSPRAAVSEEPPARRRRMLAVSATFTAEPARESLDYWCDVLRLPFDVVFAPYGQPLQQMLDPNSVLRSNRDGVNVLLVRLEDWWNVSSPHSSTDRDAQPPSGAEAIQPQMLPNGMEIVGLHGYETSHLYDEIFRRRVYLKCGVSIEDGDYVLDCGANIGMFSLCAVSEAEDVHVLAFEPAPPVFDLLRENARLHGSCFEVFNYGISDRCGSALLTSYSRASLFSGFQTDAGRDRDRLSAIIESELRSGSGLNGMAAIAAELAAGRIESTRYDVTVRTLSAIIREQRIPRVDLLKIDVEGLEGAVLRGVDDEHWPLIGQVVVEVHGGDPSAQSVAALLTERGFETVVEQDDRLRGSGLTMVYARRPGRVRTQRPAPARARALSTRVEQLNAALSVVEAADQGSWLLVLCPPSPQTTSNPRRAALFDALERNIREHVHPFQRVQVVTSDALVSRYQVPNYYDGVADRLGAVPFTPAFFVAIGTAIARAVYGITASRPKVVVVDCDDTLWDGSCGEVGPDGIAISPARHHLQKYLVGLESSGMLLCLCSRNHPEDVLAVFDRRRDMPLTIDHCVAWRINWSPKAENIHDLSRELGLSLQDFVFIDDDPVQCAEVRARCPDVLVWCLPREAAHVERFTRHLWPCDPRRPTPEDQRRTLMYRQDGARRRSRRDLPTLRSYLRSLELTVTIAPPAPDEMARIAQLTERTTQFNCSGIRRIEDGLGLAAGREFLAVHARDRFGDYGLVGAMGFVVHAEALLVDIYVLSCRALARGIEHRMIRALAGTALARGLRHVDLIVGRTARNEPARAFVDRLGAGHSPPRSDIAHGVVTTGTFDQPVARVRLPASSLSHLSFDPDAGGLQEDRDAGAPPVGLPLHDPEVLDALCRLPNELATIEQIAAAVTAWRRRSRPIEAGPLAPAVSDAERAIVDIWRDVLGVSQIGIDDDFFALGGTSVSAVRVVAQLRGITRRHVPVFLLGERSTVRSIAEYLDRGAADASAAGAARGARRREASARASRSVGRSTSQAG